MQARLSFSRGASLLGRQRPTALPLASLQLATRSSSHGHADPHASASEDVYPVESFSSPVWRNGILLTLAVVLYYRIAPSTPLSASTETEEPFLTRYIAHHLPAAGLWKARNEKHLELAKAAAEDKLLFQEAERPKVKRMRYLGTFEQASPNAIPVGSQADLSHLRIKSEKEDFAKVE